MNFNRSTKTPSPLEIANIVCRGGTEDWRKLYRELKESPSLRETALKALSVADTEAFPGCVILFQDAIHRMNADDEKSCLPGRSQHVAVSGISSPVIVR